MGLQKEQLLEIINLAIHAPSGENSQPWKFVINDNAIEIWNIPESDTSIYNTAQHGSHVAHGALIENICIAAKHNNHDATVELFPDQQETHFTARITFTESTMSYEQNEKLYNQILLRSTNRKTYAKGSLSPDLRSALENITHLSDQKLYVIDDESSIQKLSRAASVNEKFLFEIPAMNQFFFSHIRWTIEDENKDPRGFFVKTLELEPPQEAVMKLMRSKLAFSILSKLGISKVIANDNAKRYMSASAICIITSPSSTPAGFLNSGRLLERIWLTVSDAKWSMQPMSGLIFLRHALDNGVSIFSKNQVLEINDAYSTIQSVASIPGNEKVIMMFRIGECEQPTAVAKRLKPEIVIKEKTQP